MNTAFIGIDYIVDIINPSGKIPSCADQAAKRGIVDKANLCLDIAGEKNWLKILVRVGFDSDYTDLPEHSKFFGPLRHLGALQLGQPGTEFDPGLHVSAADVVLERPRISALYGTRLEAILRARGIQRLILAGASTSWAIHGTARDAHDRDYEVHVVEDACAAANEAEHASSIELIGMIASVIKAEDLRGL